MLLTLGMGPTVLTALAWTGIAIAAIVAYVISTAVLYVITDSLFGEKVAERVTLIYGSPFIFVGRAIHWFFSPTGFNLWLMDPMPWIRFRIRGGSLRDPNQPLPEGEYEKKRKEEMRRRIGKDGPTTS